MDIVTGWGPMTLSLTQSRAISSQWSSSVSVDAWKLSGTVGFSVTDTATNTETGSYTVPEGKFGTLEAYPLFDHFTFDVYDTRVADHYVGGGDAYHPVGYCYNHWANQESSAHAAIESARGHGTPSHSRPCDRMHQWDCPAPGWRRAMGVERPRGHVRQRADPAQHRRPPSKGAAKILGIARIADTDVILSVKDGACQAALLPASLAEPTTTAPTSVGSPRPAGHTFSDAHEEFPGTI
ncbi:hypothetical protein ACIGG8_42890, partial [Kitasatospora sp. NPDC085464]